MITNIQLLRGLAAFAVVFFHTAFLLNGDVHSEFQSVKIFFVISGFIMTYISRIESHQFLTQRLIRIVPPYWIVTLFFVFWQNLGFSNPLRTLPMYAQMFHHHPMDLVRFWVYHIGFENPGFTAKLIKSLFFIPYWDNYIVSYPVVSPGWSLNQEMFFYVLFAISLKLNKKWAPLFPCIVLIAIKVIYHSFGCHQLFFRAYSHPYTTFFILGILIYYIWAGIDESGILKQRKAIRHGAYLFFPAFITWNLFPQFGSTLLYFIAPVVVLYALVCHSAGMRCAWRPLLLLGDASYLLYLTHIIVLETLRTLGARWAFLDFSKSVSGLLVALCASVLFAIAAHLWIELPVLKWMRRHFVRSTPRLPQFSEVPART